jgi:DNA-directed DNA polymerase III PolC
MMSAIEVTPLHVRSGYSLQRGTLPLGRLIARAAELGHAMLALTDVNNLYAATAFYRQASGAGLHPIVGAELRPAEGESMVALVESQTGYENLCHLITRIHDGSPPAAVEGDRAGDAPDDGDPQTSAAASPTRERSDGAPGMDLAELAANTAGLALLVEDADLAEALLSAGLPKDRLHLAVDPPSQSVSRVRRLSDLADSRHLPLVAGGRALLGSSDELDLARVLAAMRLGTTYDNVPAEELPPASAVLVGPRALAERYRDLPSAAANNAALAERCAAYRLLPRRAVFPAFPCPPGRTPLAHLRQLCREGIARRYGPSPGPAVWGRLNHELDLIARKGFCEYFLVVWDIVSHARGRGAPVAGRGSGASSLVAYVLGITNVCPLAYHIPFERFLNERRDDFPDLDVDFCWRIRDEVIDYAIDRWGRAHAAMVCTHQTFGDRSAIRETAKAFGLSNDQIRRIVADPRRPAGRDEERSLAHIVRLARRLEGLPFGISVHPGGIVLSPGPLDRIAPLQPAPKGVRVTQYDKHGVEDIALVKLDLLGNRNLSTVRHACELIARRGRAAPDPEALPPDDPATVHTLRTADTIGCNQLESPAMRSLLCMVQPGDVRDVMTVLALIRPGAASVGMKEVFIRRRRGLDPVPPAPPAVADLLAGSYGVMVYEDDVMLVAAALAGLTLDEADRFRKAIQKCPDDARGLELSREFLTLCRRNGTDLAVAKDMWVQMAKYNAYSFCRAHAASYAQFAYAGAYIKTHWPAEFWTAALNNNQSMYPPRVYIDAARRDGVRIAGADVNRSQKEFDLDDDGALRLGLSVVAGLGPVGVDRIIRARGDRPFSGLADLIVRTRLGGPEVRKLILCGACDCFGKPRPALVMELNLLAGLARSGPRSPALLEAPAPVIHAPPGDYDADRKLADEWAITGLSVEAPYIARYRQALAPLTDADSRDLARGPGRRLTLAGVMEARRTTRTTRGERMMFLTMGDEFGLFEVTVFPDAAARIRQRLDDYGPYVLTGRVEEQYGVVTLSAEDVRLYRPTRRRPAPALQ